MTGVIAKPDFRLTREMLRRMIDPTMELTRWFRCPACGRLRVVQESKGKKAYVRCEPCGVQLWVRGAVGFWRFGQRLLDERGNAAPIVMAKPRKRGPGRPPKSADAEDEG